MPALARCCYSVRSALECHPGRLAICSWSSWRLIAPSRSLRFVTSIALWPWLWAGRAADLLGRVALYGVNITKFRRERAGYVHRYPLRCLVTMTPPFCSCSRCRAGRELATGAREARLWALLARVALPAALARRAAPLDVYDANRHFWKPFPPLMSPAGLGSRLPAGSLRTPTLASGWQR